MIILDTNVLSALMQSVPESAVADWLDRQPFESIWTTTITVFEIRFGFDLMPPGRRLRSLESSCARLFEEKLGNRVLELDLAAAESAAKLAAARSQRGTQVEIRDTLIAGIVLSRRATLATRNVRHFADLDATVVNPWTA